MQPRYFRQLFDYLAAYWLWTLLFSDLNVLRLIQIIC